MPPLPRTRPIHTPHSPPPQGPPPSPLILAAMGEDGVARMLADVYALLERGPLRPLFPDDMLAASRKSACFFIQVLGGRPLYSQRYGPPRMRQKHEPFEIDAEARNTWLAAFDQVLEQAEARYAFPREQLPSFRAFLSSFSNWMVNAV
jgi:hemoglobin